ncbi:glycoside hydrolase family 16 protein [Actinomadura parmotrematis]|uniref:Glycoside hydrolase family 16 protein n=1 Tax=Actinomadura parmotrematis TaxID=2864039 RepID=A0ABS7FQH3_9ACTN|nr:glycoside hydrolase family 16 protein [Actinomadura parmotrematis]MBW8482561.1 glycoside hydrolase family 16 protein [Actinomadura parmotrematis]
MRRLAAWTASAATGGALAGALAGLLLAPTTGAAAPRSATTTADRPDPGTRHLALNMDAGDRAKAAALGYDLFDVGPDPAEIDALPAGTKAMVWAGNFTCGDFALDIDDFTAAVERLAHNPRVYGWYLSDEPDPQQCPGIAADIRRRADTVHEHAPGQKAFASLTDWSMRPLRPDATHLDLIGLDPYPCRTGRTGCDLDAVDAMVKQADKAGFPRRMMVPVFQTFGQTCTSGDDSWRLPTARQLQSLLDRWHGLVPRPALDISYSWGHQQQWACPTLADADGTDGHPDLQAVMRKHNAARTTPADPGTGAGGNDDGAGDGADGNGGWGAPAVTEDFDGTRLDPAKWVVYDSPDAKVNPRTRAATTVSGGQLHLTGALYDGKDLSGGVASTLDQRYGRWEVRMRADAGAGYSAVALLWPEHFGRPEKAEIDFAEVTDATRRTTGLFTHQGDDDAQAGRTVTADFTRWRTVALDWLPGGLTFWIDGRKVWTYTGPIRPRQTPMGLALQNDQICDRGPGSCRDRTTPAKVVMDVDRVRIWRAPADGSTPSPAPTPTATATGGTPSDETPSDETPAPCAPTPTPTP